MMSDYNFNDKNNKKDIEKALSDFIKEIVANETDVRFLDYQIKINDGYINIVANNIISALWFSGLNPPNPESVFESNTFVHGDKKFRFDKRKKILQIKNKR
jgi:hypothetical protein